jgi:hypothetical protein
MGLSAPSILVKYWMGHSLGVEKSYFMPTLEKQREAYTQAYKEIDISEKPEISEVERRKQQMRDSAKLMGWNEQKLEMLEQLLIQAKTTEEIDKIPERLKQLENHDCQKIITESDLEDWLSKGFRFVSVLPSGKILISNEA